MGQVLENQKKQNLKKEDGEKVLRRYRGIAVWAPALPRHCCLVEVEGRVWALQSEGKVNEDNLYLQRAHKSQR